MTGIVTDNPVLSKVYRSRFCLSIVINSTTLCRSRLPFCHSRPDREFRVFPPPSASLRVPCHSVAKPQSSVAPCHCESAVADVAIWMRGGTNVLEQHSPLSFWRNPLQADDEESQGGGMKYQDKYNPLHIIIPYQLRSEGDSYPLTGISPALGRDVSL
jgi:hypothetical protein